MSVSVLAVLVEHALISLAPWLVGVVVGGGLGYACARAARVLISALPGLRRVSMLLPWRTAAVTVPLLSPLTPVLLGLGTVAGATMVALFVFLFALPFTSSTLLEHWYPSSLAVRLIGGFRILATASVAVATSAPMVAGSGGAGVLIFREGWSLLDYSQVLRGLCVVIVLALMVDILLGALQVLFGRTSGRALEPREVANQPPDQPRISPRANMGQTPSSAVQVIRPYDAESVAAKAVFVFGLKSDISLVDSVLRQLQAESAGHREQ
jgi:hypothetical protein